MVCLQARANKRRMIKLQEQLAELRARVARVNARYAERAQPPFDPIAPVPQQRSQSLLEDWLGGAEVQTKLGCHYETEKLYPSHQKHGSADIGSLSDLLYDLLAAISGGTTPNAPLVYYESLDTETTGLSG